MHHKNNYVIYICNVLDDQTKHERKIATDSPAATKKVFSICRALNRSGCRSIVLSMGRGRSDGSGHRFTARSCRIYGVITVYCAFCHCSRIISHLLTSLSMLCCLTRIIQKHHGCALLVYNRLWHYIPSLLLARFSGISCYLDLEDGDIPPYSLQQRILCRLFGWFCRDGALLANNALSDQVNCNRVQTCYGAVDDDVKTPVWNGSVQRLRVLFCGSLEPDTGVGMFLDALRCLHADRTNAMDRFTFIITGKGSSARDIARFAEYEGRGWCTFRGELTSSEYQRVLQRSHVGLCLKLASSAMGRTTFPSKVVEFAMHGMLLVSTKVSDVPSLFPEGSAIFIDESPRSLANALIWISDHSDRAARIARAGNEAILKQCGIDRVGPSLRDFIFPRGL